MMSTHVRSNDSGGWPGVGTTPRELAPRGRLVAVIVAALLLAWAVFALTPASAYGAEVRSGDTIVVPPGETIDDDLYAFGETVVIQGTVTGDVIAAGQSVNVAGRVSGDVMAAGSSVIVTGPIGGTARLAGQTVEISAPVGQDLLAGAATLNLGPQAAVGRDVLAGGSAITIGGPVTRSIRAGAAQLTIGAPVGGDVMAQVGTLRLVSGARIDGSLTYTSSQEAVIDPDVAVRGMATRLEAEGAAPEAGPAAQAGQRVLETLRTLVGLSVFGLGMVLLFPGFSRRATDTLTSAPWASLGYGLLLLAGAPVAALLLFVIGLMIGGWWIGLLLLAVLLALLPVGVSIVGLLVGQVTMQRAGRPNVALSWGLLAGLVVMALVSLVPVVGGIVLFAAMLFGLGAGIVTLTAIYRGRTGAAGSPSPSPGALGPSAEDMALAH